MQMRQPLYPSNSITLPLEVRELPGIEDLAVKAVLIEQILESIRRVRYVSVIRTRDISPLRTGSQ